MQFMQMKYSEDFHSLGKILSEVLVIVAWLFNNQILIVSEVFL